MSIELLTPLAQTCAFLVFLALGASIPLARSGEARRQRVIVLACYIVIAHLAIGITQKDAWPIANYRLMHGLARPQGDLTGFGFYGVDSQGREWRVDPYAWRSISDWQLQFWFAKSETLAPAQQQQALAWLFKLAEQQRAELARGNSRPSLLGPFTAPQFWMFRRHLVVPSEPYRCFRVYKESFLVADAMVEAVRAPTSHEHRVQRTFFGEWKAR